jgi:hypothetical protein
MALGVPLSITEFHAYETAPAQALAAPGVITLTERLTTLAVDGTDAYTMAAPRFIGQVKEIVIITGANPPVANITVTGMRNSTQDVWTMATFVAATAPRSVTFRSNDGLVWDCVATTGTVTVA